MMKELNILLVCGSGASSGFMAAKLRKAAAKRNVNLKATARSQSELEEYLDNVDAIMVGPHLKYELDEISRVVGESGTKVILMKPEYYAVLDGDRALDHLLSYFEN